MLIRANIFSHILFSTLVNIYYIIMQFTKIVMTDCAQNYFLDKNLAEECSGELEISNGFIVGRLAVAWPEFHKNAENLRIKSIGTENISVHPDRRNVIRLIVTFSDGSTQSAVLKLLPNILGIKKYLPDLDLDDKWDDAFLNTFKNAHNQEVEFYRLFGSQNGSKIEGFPMAKIYYSNKSAATVEESNGIPPMLIMEDLGDMAFKCGTKFNEEQSRSILTHLAMFHKHLLCLGNDEWKNGFEKQYWFEPGKQLQPLENKKMGSLQVLFEELKNALLTKEDFFGKAKEFLSAPALPEILVLGDMNPGNVLFSKAEPTQVYAFIDFQTVSLGNIVHDVQQSGLFYDFVPTNKGAALLEYYYNTLSDAMMSTTPEADGQSRAIGFGFEPLKEAFNICKIKAIPPLLNHCAFYTDPDPMVMQQLKDAYANEEEFERTKKRVMDTAENALKEALEILTNEKK